MVESNSHVNYELMEQSKEATENYEQAMVRLLHNEEPGPYIFLHHGTFWALSVGAITINICQSQNNIRQVGHKWSHFQLVTV